MPITAVDFPTVRRIEAVSFRCFPAQSSVFDGSWAIRLTSCHPAKRLNSVNPLDPGDDREIETRIEMVNSKFSQAERPVCFKVSPLAPKKLVNHFDNAQWQLIDDTKVMAMPISADDYAADTDLLPFRDQEKWCDAFLQMGNEAGRDRDGMVQVMGAINASNGLFLMRDKEGNDLAAARCVCLGDMAGLFDIVTAEDQRGKGHAKTLVRSALKWAVTQGASRAWLQVVADNQAACRFYDSLGFEELYRYHYRKPAGEL